MTVRRQGMVNKEHLAFMSILGTPVLSTLNLNLADPRAFNFSKCFWYVISHSFDTILKRLVFLYILWNKNFFILLIHDSREMKSLRSFLNFCKTQKPSVIIGFIFEYHLPFTVQLLHLLTSEVRPFKRNLVSICKLYSGRAFEPVDDFISLHFEVSFVLVVAIYLVLVVIILYQEMIDRRMMRCLFDVDMAWVILCFWLDCCLKRLTNNRIKRLLKTYRMVQPTYCHRYNQA